MLFGSILSAVKGNVVLFPSYVSSGSWVVVRVRDRRNDPLLPDTYRRRPENLRSQCYAVVRNLKTGRLRTFYSAETLPCFCVEV